ncbi:hypothetical protein R6Q59_013584 [Mikania micrantha]|uniref:Uncharacterized protein n=1 Tax=Mikania micrantha TaxID=192012 RepID=A0A5N6P656_9ASTR|nr:hypothetical protein E3N88_11962 [Mikania micrantha]KAD5960493.1 hypothetical protein E3N88_11965 [Mikania micrantha]
MATNNVFGTPITEGASRTDRAIKAVNNPNADGKRDAAIAYVRQLKHDWGNGVSTLGIFYNATGENLVFAKQDSWYGEIVGPFPMRVQNGQWGAFFHGKMPIVPSGSVAFVVYRVKADDTQFCDQLIAWQTPFDQVSCNNQAYCEIFDDEKVDIPGAVYHKMDKVNSPQCSARKKGMMVSSTIELGTSPLYIAEFTREDAVALKGSVDVGEA